MLHSDSIRNRKMHHPFSCFYSLSTTLQWKIDARKAELERTSVKCSFSRLGSFMVISNYSKIEASRTFSLVFLITAYES